MTNPPPRRTAADPHPGAAADKEVTVTVDLVGPVDVAGSLDAYCRHDDDLIDRWDGEVLVRTVPHRRARVALASQPVGSADRPRLSVTGPAHLTVAALSALAAGQFQHDQAALDELAARDPMIATLGARYRGLAVLTQTDLLHTLVRCITAQQITTAFAAVLRGRLARLLGRPLRVGPYTAYALDSNLLAATSPERLRELQFSARKSAALVGVARAVAEGTLSPDTVADREDDEVVAKLTALPGIGRWSAEWFLVRALGRSHVVAGDLAVRKAVGHLYHPDHPPPGEEQVRRLTAHWGAASALAQTMALENHRQARLRSRSASTRKLHP
jgi:DNA-3-methyladenine glycosylase II